ncbi:uncharacterized protein ASCRUDRAFT_8725 [Ascoidea rubescens DSM 1968]|uniref:L domain-like protein n=1 Tax=Ascoidea rubescens DSM 1968 TaxID=1344418 RepID=A0A1D2VFW1_9ASCO|nr:hypothetical protein ASCRUDRAFT_8725 [Ascoidea rubescens DSM 1968]ODV60516.1 hypothetical protein ASCRUDRAFT_8725 [Ascoidea rubescens DSM 1968]
MDTNQLHSGAIHNGSNQIQMISPHKHSIDIIPFKLVNMLFTLSGTNLFKFSALSLLLKDLQPTNLSINNKKPYLKIRFNHLHLFKSQIYNFCSILRIFFEHSEELDNIDILDQFDKFTKAILNNSEYLKDITLCFGYPKQNELPDVLKTPCIKSHDIHTIDHGYFDKLNHQFYENKILKDFSIINIEISFGNIWKIADYKIAAIGNCHKLSNLTKLTIKNTNIERIENLTSLVHVTILDLLDNDISEITSISELERLKVLRLEGNLFDKET